jgi:putative hydrolase of the HAD superfamily
MSELKYNAVLCDIDGVLRHWPPTDAFDHAHHLPPGTFAAAAFAPQRLIPAITGQITDEQWRADTEDALATACGSRDTARNVVTAWSNQLPAIDTEVAALLRKVRRIMPVALVSNATTRLEEDLEKQGLGDLTDNVVNTSRLGYAKPDPRVYVAAAQRVGAPVHRCLFIDDTAANVAAARNLGMAAIHYRQFADLQQALAHLLEAPGPSEHTDNALSRS